jgi:adenosylmethionine-8-amino-7-oxononanoate aminotransferase
MAPAILLDEALPSNDISLANPKGSTLHYTLCPAEERKVGLMHRSLTALPHEVTSASGSYLHLASGASILDGCGGAEVAIIGHGNEEVLAATIAQMQKVSYVHTISYTTSSAADLANFILEVPPGGFQHGLEKAYFCGSGSEANDAGMKLARQYFFEKGESQRKW